MVNSKKFYDRVSGKLPLGQHGSVNIVFLGDSVTHGCFASGYGIIGHDRFASYTMKFHKMISVLFPNTVFNIINSGIGGDTATTGLARLDRDVIAYHPDLVVVSFGLNDTEILREILHPSAEFLTSSTSLRSPAFTFRKI